MRLARRFLDGDRVHQADANEAIRAFEELLGNAIYHIRPVVQKRTGTGFGVRRTTHSVLRCRFLESALPQKEFKHAPFDLPSKGDSVRTRRMRFSSHDASSSESKQQRSNAGACRIPTIRQLLESITTLILNATTERDVSSVV